MACQSSGKNSTLHNECSQKNDYIIVLHHLLCVIRHMWVKLRFEFVQEEQMTSTTIIKVTFYSLS